MVQDRLSVRTHWMQSQHGIHRFISPGNSRGIALIGLLGHGLYGRAVTFAEELPVYNAKIKQAIEPISRKIEKVQQSAGSLTNDVQPIKKSPRLGCGNRRPGLPIWCVVRDLSGEC